MSKYRIVLLFVVVLLTALLIQAWLVSPDKSTESSAAKNLYRVTRVTDGDTIVVESGGKEIRVRLIGVRAPEKPGGRLAEQCFGKEAWNYLQKKLTGKKVRLEEDSIGDKEDKYKRSLRYVYLENENINAELIRNGYAYVYREFKFSKKDEFKKLETDARGNSRGLWKACPERNKKRV